MEYLAKWGSKGFLVSPNKIVPLLDISTAFERKSETSNDTSGTPTTNTMGMELQQISLETIYVAAAGVDPRAQIDEWKSQFGKRYPLYLNGKQFGPNLLELVSVEFSDIMLDNKGRILSVSASITLEEYAPAGDSKSTSGSSTKSGAMAATASSDDKANKKSTTAR